MADEENAAGLEEGTAGGVGDTDMDEKVRFCPEISLKPTKLKLTITFTSSVISPSKNSNSASPKWTKKPKSSAKCNPK